MNELKNKNDINEFSIKYSNIKKYYDFSIGEPHFNINKDILEEIKNHLHEKCPYSNPQGLYELRKKLGKYYNSSEENILIGSGTSSLLNLIINSYLKCGDTVLLFEPYYFSYEFLLTRYGINIVKVSERFEKINVKEKIDMIIFSNPSNPTGYCYSHEQLKEITSFAKKNNAIIVADEIYRDFDYDNSFVSIKEYSDNAIILWGFSKAYSMTGLRLGSVYADTDIINKLTNCQMHCNICIPEPIQWGGVKALDISIDNQINYYKENRNYVAENLSKVCDIDIPKAGFYFFINVRNEKKFLKEMWARNIKFASGKLFTKKDGYVRMSICLSREDIISNMDVIRNEIINCR